MEDKIDEAIKFYLKKKIDGEMSLQEIKLELNNQFNKADAKFISSEIVDKELDNLKTGNSILDLFNHIGFSYVMRILTLIVIGTSLFIVFWEYTSYNQISVYPLAFVAGAILLYSKHHIKIKKHLRKKSNE